MYQGFTFKSQSTLVLYDKLLCFNVIRSFVGNDIYSFGEESVGGREIHAIIGNAVADMMMADHPAIHINDLYHTFCRGSKI